MFWKNESGSKYRGLSKSSNHEPFSLSSFNSFAKGFRQLHSPVSAHCVHHDTALRYRISKKRRKTEPSIVHDTNIDMKRAVPVNYSVKARLNISCCHRGRSCAGPTNQNYRILCHFLHPWRFKNLSLKRRDQHIRLNVSYGSLVRSITRSIRTI